MSGGRQGPSLWERIYRALQILYPGDFRRRFGNDMTAAASQRAERERRQGRWNEAACWLRTMLDILPSALRARRPPSRRIEVNPRLPLGDVLRDARYAMRTFVRKPAVPLAVVLTLSVGIGATTAMFSVIDTVLLRPLPYPAPDQLVRLVGRHRVQGSDINAVNLEDLRDWVRRSGVLSAATAYGSVNLTLTGEGTPERVYGGVVSQGYFRVLGVSPALGRPFAAGEFEFGGPRALVLTHDYWASRFGGDRTVLGRTLRLNDTPYQVVGVLPPNHTLIPSNDWRFVTPLVIDPASWQAGRGPTWLSALGRLEPGVSVQLAQHSLDLVVRDIGEEFPQVAWRGVRVAPLKETVIGPARSMLRLLVLAVVFVLLIGCSSVANLLLARASNRRRAFAVRASMGAGRARLARQVLTESLVLAGIGGVIGVLLAHLGLDTVLGLSGGSIPRATEIGIDGRVLLFSALVSVAVGIGFGLAPALRVARVDLAAEMKEGGHGAGAGAAVQRVRSVLVTVQLAFSVVLLVSAGLLVKSLWRLSAVDPGFDPTGVITFSVTLPSARYGNDTLVNRFYQQLAARFSALPGVVAVGAADGLPPAGSSWFSSFTIGGVRPPREGEDPSTEIRRVTPGFFSAMGVPVRTGRSFDPTDRAGAPPVAVVNEASVTRYFDGQPPLGRRIGFDGRAFEIVGVVGDVRQSGIDTAPTPAIYFARDQLPFSSGYGVVRLSGDPWTLVPTLRDELRRIDPDIPLASVATLEERLGRSLVQPKFRAALLASFAGIALTLALLGIYSVVAFAVSQRTREIGIRIALGSDRNAVRWLILRQGLFVAGLALSLGIAGALAVAHLLESFLFGVRARDPATLAAVALLLLAVAVLASILPARAATRIDPMAALRSE